MALRPLLGLLLAALLLAPAASAHSQNPTADGKYTIIVGHLNEPVTTYTKTGLDIRIQTADGTKTPVVINTANLTATLVAPDGQELHQALKAQFGVAGGYTFDEPYVLTQAGAYKLKLKGDVLGSTIDRTDIVVGSANPIPALGDVTFPDTGVQGNKELQDRITTLEQKVGALQAQQAAASTNKGAPGFEASLLVAAVGILAFARSRQA